jgi:para-aminobenzoate synthetase component 1
MSSLEAIAADARFLVTQRLSSTPTRCHHRLSEIGRYEWRIGDSVEWTRSLEHFLSSFDLLAGDLTYGNSAVMSGDMSAHSACGAMVLISAAAGAHMGGSDLVGPPTPAPAVPDVVAVVYGPVDSTFVTGPSRPWRLGEWEPSWTPRAHATAVSRVREAIGRGDVYQVNVVGHASAPYAGDPGPALHRVAGLPGARYGGVLSGSGWAVASASPETLVEVSGGTVRTRPIKGTRPATEAGRAALLASAKERAEHIMIVDLERNDLARVARTGSVRVTDLYRLRAWSGLWQAESEVTAELLPGTGLSALLHAVFPGGSVTGAPKRAALDLIADLEPVGRGPSMGAFGWIGRDGIDLGLTIRTVAVDAERVHVWAGGGITWDSDPAEEVAEAASKAAPIRAALA